MSEARRARRERFDAELSGLLRCAYEEGLEDGLAVAKRIRDWLTRQPDTARQRQIREWADAAIDKAGVAWKEVPRE